MFDAAPKNVSVSRIVDKEAREFRPGFQFIITAVLVCGGERVLT